MIVGIILEKKKKEKALVNGWYHYDEEKIYHVANYIIPPLLREKFIGSNKQHKPRTMLANTKEIKKKIYGQPDPHVCLSISLSLSLSPQDCVDSHNVVQKEAKLQEIVVPELISAVLFIFYCRFIVTF